MSRLAIARMGRGARSTIGDIPGLTQIVSDVEASARAELYQQLADFQGIPQRLNRVVSQLNAFMVAAPGRSADESARLTALEAGVSALQSEWGSTNTTVTNAIAAVSGGGSALDVAGVVAAALTGMTVAAQGIGVLEQQARDLISTSSAIDDAQRASILALGAPWALDAITVAKYVVGGIAVIKLVQWLRERRR